MKTVAVVIPVFNEADNADLLCDRLGDVIAAAQDYRFEVIIVDDGSSDATVECFTARKDDLPMTIIRFTQNFGHQAALKAGLDHADADAVITMDGDLQHPPEKIPVLIDAWRNGAKVVNVLRDRQVRPTVRNRMVRIAYATINLFAERPIPPESADFRLIDRSVINALRRMRSPKPMLRGLIAWAGFPTTNLTYQLQPRAAGTSRYTLRQFFGLLFSGIFDFSLRPLKLSALAGILLLILAVGGMCMGGVSDVEIAVLAVTAIVLALTTLVGVEVGHAYRKSLNWPKYIVSETLNIEPQKPYLADSSA